MAIPIYFINLASRTDRLSFMTGQFERLGLSAIRIEAVTRADLSAAQLDRYCNPRNARWLSPAQFCNSLSHQRVASEFLTSAERYALVLEDDAVLSSLLPAFLNQFSELAPDIDLLRLETTTERMRLQPTGLPALTGVEIFRLYSWTIGTCAYIMSRKTADEIVRTAAFQSKPVDAILANPYAMPTASLRLMQTMPGLSIQTERWDDAPVLPSTTIAEMKNAPRHRYIFSLRGFLDWRIVWPAEKAWYEFFRGARKRGVPFMP